MNQAIRNTWVVIIALFVVLFAAASYIQVVGADTLNNNEANTRQLYKQFGSARGPILVDGEPIAESVPAESENFEYQRVYNNAELYSGITGFYSLTYGATGLENKLNDELAGTSDGQFVDRLVQMFSGTPMEGAQVELTLDSEMQQLAWDALPDGVQGTAIISDPETGNILALATRPSYDTNLLAVHSGTQARQNMEQIQADGIFPYRNMALNERWSPGSTFKLIDTIAMLESGDYDSDTVLEVPDQITLPQSQTTLSNFGGGLCSTRNEAPLTWIFAQSCNTPFANAAMDLGQDALLDTAERFGFNQTNEIPLTVSDSHFPTEEISDAALAQSAIGGQDVQATPLQMNMVAAGIANGGTIMQPQLIDSVRGPDLTLISQTEPQVFSEATSPEIAEQVTELMKETMRSGTGYRGRSNVVEIAAKTGTSQPRDVDGVTVVDSWITGFAPADNPQVAVTLAYRGIPYENGSRLTAENMKNIMEAVVEQ